MLARLVARGSRRLARSDAATVKIKALGATAVPGSAEDLDALVRYAGEADTTVFVGPG